LDILLLESLIPEAMAWLEARHSLAYRPALAHDERALRHSTTRVRAVVVPNHVLINQDFLDFAPKLEVVARMQVGTDNIDLETCRDRGIKVLQARSANVRANAEYLVGALLLLFRQGMLSALTPQAEGSAVPQKPALAAMGREINGSTIGLLGIGPAASVLAGLLTAMGARLIGYDPALHHSSPLWLQMRVQPVSLLDLMSSSDAVSVQMLYASRFRGFVNDRVLAACKRQQAWVSISRSALFESGAMADALKDGRISAWMTDSSDESEGQGLLRSLPNFYATPRVGSLTREAHMRASWYMAHRLHDALVPEGAVEAGLASRPMELGLPGDRNPSNWLDSMPPSSLPPPVTPPASPPVEQPNTPQGAPPVTSPRTTTSKAPAASRGFLTSRP
jgi:phosphoglycerate dehydrogenase-like enzyme